jgi:protein-tyrosine phosphatase
MRIVEVIQGLYIGTKLVPPAEFSTLGVDAIVDLEDWEFAWVPPVPSGCIYMSFPIEDGDRVDPKVTQVAAFVAMLVQSGHRVLVHCTEGLNRSGLVVARAMLDMEWNAADAIEQVRHRRGPSEDGFSALSNERLVEWLLSEELGGSP